MDRTPPPLPSGLLRCPERSREWRSKRLRRRQVALSFLTGFAGLAVIALFRPEQADERFPWYFYPVFIGLLVVHTVIFLAMEAKEEHRRKSNGGNEPITDAEGHDLD